MTVTKFDAFIADQFLNKLSAANWDLDDATLDNKAGACSACKKRTGVQEGLFGDLLPDGTGKAAKANRDRCTDAHCYLGKDLALTTRFVTDARKDHPKLVLLTIYGAAREWKDAKTDWDWQAAKKSDKKATPVLFIDGDKNDGKVRTMKPRTSGQTGGMALAGGKRAERKGETAAAKFKRLKEAHDGRIYSDVVDAIAKKLRTLKVKTPDKATVETAFAFVMRFGLPFHENAGGYDYRFLDKIGTGKELIDAAFKNLLGTWCNRLKWHNRDGMHYRFREAKVLAKMYGLPIEKMLETSEAAHPEPATWSKLRQDVKTEKAKAAKKEEKAKAAKKEEKAKAAKKEEKAKAAK